MKSDRIEISAEPKCVLHSQAGEIEVPMEEKLRTSRMLKIKSNIDTNRYGLALVCFPKLLYVDRRYTAAILRQARQDMQSRCGGNGETT